MTHHSQEIKDRYEELEEKEVTIAGRMMSKREMCIRDSLWCGIANGAEDILLPENYDYDEQKIIENIIANRRKGKKNHIIINAEGIGHSTSMARRIEAATGIETRATLSLIHIWHRLSGYLS